MKIVVSDTTGDPEDSEPVGGLNRSAMVKKTPLLERANFATVYWFSVSSECVNAAQGRLMRADCGHSQISFGEKSRKPDDLDMDLLRKSGEFFVMKEDLYDQAEAANEGI